MGRGSKEASYQGSLIFAAIKNGKKGEKVHFELKKKDPTSGQLVVDGIENKLSGFLQSLSIRDWEYNGEAKQNIVLVLSDPTSGTDGETYKIEVSTEGGMGRNVMNTLLKADKPSLMVAPLSVSVWNNEAGYANITLRLDDQKMEWAFNNDDLADKITVNKKKVKGPDGKIVVKEEKDYTEVNVFILEEFKKSFGLTKENSFSWKVGKAEAQQKKTVYDGLENDTQAAVVEETVAGEDGLPWEKE